MEFFDICLDDLHIVCKEIQTMTLLNKHVIILLYGDIGAGKTSFVKEYARLVGISDCVVSPTFSLMCHYDNRIFHYDFYNRSNEMLIQLGILDLLDNEGIHFIEWPNSVLDDIIGKSFDNIIKISIDKQIDSRNYRIF